MQNFKNMNNFTAQANIMKFDIYFLYYLGDMYSEIYNLNLSLY